MTGLCASEEVPWFHFNAQAWEDWASLGEKTTLLDFLAACQKPHIHPPQSFQEFEHHISQGTLMSPSFMLDKPVICHQDWVPESAMWRANAACLLVSAVCLPIFILGRQRVEEKRGRNLCFLSKLIGSHSQIFALDSSMDLLNPLSSLEDQVEAASPQVHTFLEHDFFCTYL